MKFWQCLAMLDMQELPVLARHAEDLGFEGVSLSEHMITFSEQYDSYDYSDNNNIRWYPSTHWPDPWVQIAALSQVTTKLKFLTSVYVLPLHDPFSVAKSVSTAANLCGGRLILGVGIGWQKSEFELVGQNFHNRGKRCDEMLEVMQKLWSGSAVSHEGTHYRFPLLQMSPGLHHQLPIYVGGFAEAALRRASRQHGWIGGQHSMEELEQLIPVLLAYRQASGLPVASFDICVGLYDQSEGNIRRCKELGVTGVYRHAFCDENGMASRMSLDDKLRDMERFAQLHFT